MKYITLLILISVYSCNKKDTYKTENIKKNIQGVWAENINENALFYIKKDSIYYIDSQDNPLFIKFENNDFSIDFDGYSSKNSIIKLDKDSLVFKNQDNSLIKLVRIKE